MAISTEEMRARQEAAQGEATSIAQAIQEVSDRTQLLVREEIELAKAEVTAKVTQLVKGAAVGLAAGIFSGTARLLMLHSLARAANSALPAPDPTVLSGVLLGSRPLSP